jgi:hypothetical protein
MSSLAIPDNVKEVISRLSVQDQIIIRSYIAGMRDELKELRAKLEHGHDGDDPHAHYHGHEVSNIYLLLLYNTSGTINLFFFFFFAYFIKIIIFLGVIIPVSFILSAKIL